MKAIAQRLSGNSIVVYTNEEVKTGKGIKYGHIECGIKYYFCTQLGYNSLNEKLDFLRRGCSQSELETKLKML